MYISAKILLLIFEAAWKNSASSVYSLREVHDLERYQGGEFVVVERDRGQLVSIRCGKARFLEHLFNLLAIAVQQRGESGDEAFERGENLGKCTSWTACTNSEMRGARKPVPHGRYFMLAKAMRFHRRFLPLSSEFGVPRLNAEESLTIRFSCGR